MTSLNIDPNYAVNHLFLTMENMLDTRYVLRRNSPSNIGGKEYMCINNDVRDLYIAVIVSQQNTNNFGNIREIISQTDKKIRSDGGKRGILSLFVNNSQVGDKLMDKIERIDDLIVLCPLYIALAIKNSNPLGPISFHNEIAFDDINTYSRKSPKVFE